MFSNKLFAHRGLSSLYPENTLISFEKAVLAGYQCIECDVLLTKDMIPVICHDENLKKLTEHDVNLIDITFNDFKKLKIAHTLSRQTTEPCSLNELLLWKKKHPSLKINLELKTQQGIFPKNLIQIIKQSDLDSKSFLFSSFDEQIILEILKEFPNHELSFLSHKFTKNQRAFCLEHSLFSINLDINYINIPLIEELFSLNFSLGLFTVNEWHRINHYLSQKFDRIFTDHPSS